MNSSDVKYYWSDGLVKNALFDNILYTINKFILILIFNWFFSNAVSFFH
jgi:hypothetical protein